MSITIQFHKDDSTQSDFKNGAIDFKSTNPQVCFELGTTMQEMLDNNKRVVHGEWGQGVFIRIPLSNNP